MCARRTPELSGTAVLPPSHIVGGAHGRCWGCPGTSTGSLEEDRESVRQVVQRAGRRWV